jgi:hypothetical protein
VVAEQNTARSLFAARLPSMVEMTRLRQTKLR